MKLGRYEVIRTLGQGGTAKVLLAKSASGQPVVLKVPLRASTDHLERLRDEARVGLRLQHPGIVETLDLFEHEGKPILVVEYVDGPTLQLIRRLGPLEPAAVARVGRQVAEALAAIHEARDEHDRPLGILHRDVTPANILINRQGDAKLIDLGIARSVETQARATQAGAVRGTLRYLAPELLAGKKHSVTTDLWALGVALWETALGRRSMEGEDADILRRIQRVRVMEYLPGERLDPRLHDAIAALISEENARIQRAAAAANILRRLEEELGDGQDGCIEAVETALRAKRVRDEAIGSGTQELIAGDRVPTASGSVKSAKSGDTQPQPRPVAHLDAEMGSDDRAPTLQMRASEIAEIEAKTSSMSGKGQQKEPTSRIHTSASAPDTLPGGDKRKQASSTSDVFTSKPGVARVSSSDASTPVPEEFEAPGLEPQPEDDWEGPTRYDRSGPAHAVPAPTELASAPARTEADSAAPSQSTSTPESPSPGETPRLPSALEIVPAPEAMPSPDAPFAPDPTAEGAAAAAETPPGDLIDEFTPPSGKEMPSIDAEGPTMIRAKDSDAAAVAARALRGEAAAGAGPRLADPAPDTPAPKAAAPTAAAQPRATQMMFSPDRTALDPGGPPAGLEHAEPNEVSGPRPVSGIGDAPTAIKPNATMPSSDDKPAPKSGPAGTLLELESISELPTQMQDEAADGGVAEAGRTQQLPMPPASPQARPAQQQGERQAQAQPAAADTANMKPPASSRSQSGGHGPAPAARPKPRSNPAVATPAPGAQAPGAQAPGAQGHNGPTATQAFFAADVEAHMQANPTTTGELEAAFKPRPGRAIAMMLVFTLIVAGTAFGAYSWWKSRAGEADANGGTEPSAAVATPDAKAPPEGEAKAPPDAKAPPEGDASADKK